MFRLGNIVNSIEAKRHEDIRLANYNTATRTVIKKVPTKASNIQVTTTKKPIMIDKSTMTETETKSVYCDTTELENKAREIAVLEKFKKAQEEKIAKTALMRAVLGAPKGETYDAEDE